MPRVVLCLNSDLGHPSLERLAADGHLAGVVVPRIEHSANTQALERAEAGGIPALRVGANELGDALPAWLETIGAEVGFVQTFPYRIPAAGVDAFPHGLWNFHFGLLPAYRGPDPIFWQIKNRETHGGITVHQVTEGVDEGPILHEESIVFAPTESYGIHVRRLASAAAELLPHVLERLEERPPVLHPQDPDRAGYQPKPTGADVTIDWTASAAEADALVRACNPNYDGAIASFDGNPWRILEALQVEGELEGDPPPGTVVQADLDNGVFVMCGADGILCLSVVRTREGFLSGRKLALLGVRTGLRFDVTASDDETG